MRFLTIAEYAELNQISPQAVYKKINKGKLEAVSRKDNTGKMIKYIILYDTEEQESEIKPEEKPVSQPAPPEVQRDLNQLNQSINQPANQPHIQREERESGNPQIIDLLVSQLSEKDKQIERLQAQVERQAEEAREKDRVIQEQIVKLNELLTNSQQLQAQANVLLLDKKPEEPIEVYQQAEKPEEKKKISFWKRLFK